MAPVSLGGGDGYSHPPPLSRLLSPQAGQTLPVSHLQISPLLHPLVGQHILSVRQFSKEQVRSAGLYRADRALGSRAGLYGAERGSMEQSGSL